MTLTPLYDIIYIEREENKMFYKIKWTDADTGERITKYLPTEPVEDVLAYLRDLDEDPYVIDFSAILVDTVRLTEDDTFGNRW